MPKEFRTYRANKNNTGSAIAWQLSYKKDEKYDKFLVFLVGAVQTGIDENGNGQFDWKGGLTVKLGENDLGEIISVLERRKNAVGFGDRGLFHQTAKGNKVISFNLLENGYGIKISAQDTEKNKKEVKQVISFGEASTLLVLLKRAV